MKDIKLKLSVQEVNVVINALGQRPYTQVHEIIGKIHAQAKDQLADTNGAVKTKAGKKAEINE